MSGKCTELFTKSDVAAVLFLTVLFLVGGALRIYQKSRAVISPEVVINHMEPETPFTASKPASPGVATAEMPAKHKININSAPAESLVLLPGIGPHLANRIIEHRNRNGSFRGTGDLELVNGIGPGKLEAIRSMITVGDE